MIARYRWPLLAFIVVGLAIAALLFPQYRVLFVISVACAMFAILFDRIRNPGAKR